MVEQGNPKGVKGLDDLADPDLKVVLAAEEVPAGKYAKQVLDQAGVGVTPVSQEDNVKAVVARCPWARPTPASSTSPTSPPAATRSRGSTSPPTRT